MLALKRFLSVFTLLPSGRNLRMASFYTGPGLGPTRLTYFSACCHCSGVAAKAPALGSVGAKYGTVPGGSPV